jgi:hypothetical protein
MAWEEIQSAKQDKCTANKEKIFYVLWALVTQLFILVFQNNVSIVNITGDCREQVIRTQPKTVFDTTVTSN